MSEQKVSVSAEEAERIYSYLVLLLDFEEEGLIVLGDNEVSELKSLAQIFDPVFGR